VGLEVVTRLGFAEDRRLDPALAVLKGKRTKEGIWVMDRVHPDLGAGAGYRMKKAAVKPFVLEREGKPSKWITLRALRVLKRVQEAQ
jgi:hypothetical protein